MNNTTLETITNKLLEADYPSEFKLAKLESISTFKGRKDYLDGHLRKLGAGSSRIVYEVDNNTVLKFAKNKKGIAQNLVEIELSEDSYLSVMGIFAEIYEYGEHGLWLEMQKAKKCTPKLFNEIVGLTFDDYVVALTYMSGKSNKLDSNFDIDELYENEFLESMTDFLSNFKHIPIADYTRMSSYGVVTNGTDSDVVLVDYGLNEDVYDKYYR